MKIPARPIWIVTGAILLILATLNGLTYLGSDSPVASVRLSKDSRSIPLGVRVYARDGQDSPIEGVQFSYETLSGITPSATTDSNGFAFIKRVEDNKVLGLYIADEETHRYTEIWDPIYDSNLFARFLGTFFDPTVNIEFRVKLHSLPYKIRTEQGEDPKPDNAPN
jgi:hypothetical protein